MTGICFIIKLIVLLIAIIKPFINKNIVKNGENATK